MIPSPGAARVARTWMALFVVAAGLASACSRGSAATSTAVTAVTGSACGYYVNVGLFGGPQQLRGCNQPSDAAPAAASPLVTLPRDGSEAPITAIDADGAAAQYGPAVIFGGRWPDTVASGPPSGPMTVRVQGTPASKTVRSSADIVLLPSPAVVRCEPAPTPPTPPPVAGQVCTAPGGFGPFPVEGNEAHASCVASAAGVTGTTHLVKAELATSTDTDGNPKDKEAVPDDPPPNYTRSGVITNVGDVFTVVYNEQIQNPDGSLTVNAVHMYLFGPTAVGEVVKASATCGLKPAPSRAKDIVPPRCGTVVVEPLGPDNPAPKTPRTELLGVFDAGGLKSVTNVKATNGTVQVGDPAGAKYLQFAPGQTGPLPVVATRTPDAEKAGAAMTWSFDAVDSAGNTSHCTGGSQ